MSTEILRYAAFTDTPEGGNPAGVVLDASGLGDAEMQAIAADVGYSETAFVTAADGNDLTSATSPRSPRCRSAATPRSRPASPGATATATALLRLTTPAGLVEVDVADGVATLTSVAPSTRRARRRRPRRAARARWAGRAPTSTPAAAARRLRGRPPPGARGAAASERLADARLRLRPPRRADGRARLDHDPARAPRGPDRFRSRNPFPPGGVVEDPATGAAAAAFGGYLRELGPRRAARHDHDRPGHRARPPEPAHGHDPRRRRHLRRRHRRADLNVNA